MARVQDELLVPKRAEPTVGWERSSGSSAMRRVLRAVVARARDAGAECVLLCVFATQAFRHLWIADDGYIYLAYIRNFTENGFGAVLNPHAPVEGYTSSGWFFLLSFANLLRPSSVGDLRQLTIVLSLVMSVGALAVWFVIERRASGEELEGTKRVTFNVPLAVLAGTFAVYSFATSGLETPLEYLFLSCCVLYVFRSKERFVIAALLIGFAPFVRPDFVLFSFLLALRYLRRGGPHPVRLLTVCALPTLALTAFRVWYYGALLPNTYYAKTDTVYGAANGWAYVREFAASYPATLLLLAAIAVAVAVASVLRRRGAPLTWRVLRPLRDPRQFLVVCAAVYIAYVVDVGGDFMHGRMLLPPLFLTLGVFAGAGTYLVRQLRAWPEWARRGITVVALAAIALVALHGQPVENAQPQKGAERDGISNEERGLEGVNPHLHRFGVSVGQWGTRGIGMRLLSVRLGTEVGFAVRALGETSYQAVRDRGRVYIYDRLGLADPSVARLDMGGRRVGRVGASKSAPDVMIDLDPRVDFAFQHFPGYGSALMVEYRGFGAPLVNFDLLPRLVARGVVTPARADAMRAWLRAALSAPRIDRNLVFLLSERYHAHDDIRARLDALAPLARSSAWARWARRSQPELKLLAPRPPSGNFFDRFRLALRRHRSARIEYIPFQPDIVPNPIASLPAPKGT